MKPLLLLALACAVHAAPATQAPAPGWTPEKVRAALARLDAVPAPPPGVLVTPLSTGGKPIPGGGALAALAMLSATYVPRQVLAPHAYHHLDVLPVQGWCAPSLPGPAVIRETARMLGVQTIATAVTSDAGPEPELTLSIEGPAGARVFTHRAKLAALVPWIALRIHEYLGTAPGGDVVTETRGNTARVRPGGTRVESSRWSFQRGYEYELLPGKWIKKIFVDDKEVASETFELVP